MTEGFQDFVDLVVLPVTRFHLGEIRRTQQLLAIAIECLDEDDKLASFYSRLKEADLTFPTKIRRADGSSSEFEARP